MTAWAYLDHPGPIPFAHRGGVGEHPENTLVAFEHAVRLGYRYLETDAHTTADGVLVAFHDHVLERVTDRSGLVANLPWDTVREARLDEEGIPLMEELLTAWPDTRVNVDLKSDGAVEAMVEVLRRTGTHDRVCVASFSGRRLDRFRRLSSGRVCTATSPVEIARLRAAGFGLPSGRLAGACAQVPVRRGPLTVVDPRFLAAAHARHIPVHAWTINDRAEMEHLLDMGIDGIMTDRLTVLKEVLVRRGQWS